MAFDHSKLISSELEVTNHAELYLTWSSNLLALISRSVNLKKRAKGAARLAARSVRTNRGKVFKGRGLG